MPNITFELTGLYSCEPPPMFWVEATEEIETHGRKNGAGALFLVNPAVIPVEGSLVLANGNLEPYNGQAAIEGVVVKTSFMLI